MLEGNLKMAQARDKFEGEKLEVVADNMAGIQPEFKNTHEPYTEFVFRTTMAQIQLAESQRNSAEQ